MSKLNVVAYINSPYITVKLPLPAIYELSGDACKLYSLMRFRMVMSIDGKKYYDFKNGHYYIIYPNKELNALAHLKKNAFYKAINELKQKGYIKKTSTKRKSIIRLPKAEPYYVPRYNLKPRKTGLNNKLDNPYIKLGSLNNKLGSLNSKLGSLNNKPQGLNSKPRNRTNINNQYDNQNYNSVYMNNAENKFSGVIKNKHESLGLSINSLKAISGFSKNYKEFSLIINKLFTVTSYSHNNRLREYKKLGLFISKKLRNFGTSPYFTSNVFINDLTQVFGQADYNTNHNNKTPNRKEYGGYLVSTLTERMVYYLKKHKYIKVTKRKSSKPDESKNTKDLLKDDKQYDKEYEKNRQPTSSKEIKKLELSQAEDNINNYGLSVKPEKFVKIQNGILKKLKNKNKNVDECNLNGKAIKLTVKHIQNKAEPKQHKHGFGHPVNINTGKSTDNQDNKRDAHKSKKNTPKKSPSKPLNHKSNTNTQSDTKMNDSSTHKKNKDTAVGRKTELSKLRDEYNRIADDKKFKEIHSKMVNNKDTTKAERKFCINKSQRLTPITNKIQKIKRQIEKDKANAIPNTADNSNDSSDEDLPF